MHRLLHPAGDHRRGHCLAATASHARKLSQIVIWQSCKVCQIYKFGKVARQWRCAWREAESRRRDRRCCRIVFVIVEATPVWVIVTCRPYFSHSKTFFDWQTFVESVFARLGRGPHVYLHTVVCYSLHSLTKTWVKILCELDWSEWITDEMREFFFQIFPSAI